MAQWQDSFAEWSASWASARESDASGELVIRWPGTELSGAPTLHVVTDDPAGLRDAAASSGLVQTDSLVLLEADTEDLDLVPHLPANANMAEAPMENYDAVEVALFDRPVARGRMNVGEDSAVLAMLSVDADAEPAGDYEQAMIAALGEEAFLHGADTLFLVAPADQAERVAAVPGWSRAAEILTFTGA